MVLLRKVASVLLPTVVLSAAWVHKCQAEPPDPKVDADLVESLDASKERTLAELSKMATVSGEEYDRIKVKIQQGLEESLKPVGDAITKTKELVDERFGAWDALSQESRQTKLEAALKDGGLEPALSEMANQIRRTLEAVGQEFLDQRHQELKLILRSNLMQRFPTPIDDYLLEGLERDNRLNIEKEKELSTDLQGKKPVAVLGTAAVIIARRALQKIFQKIGGTFLKKLMGNAVVRSVLFPGEAGGLLSEPSRPQG